MVDRTPEQEALIASRQRLVFNHVRNTLIDPYYLAVMATSLDGDRAKIMYLRDAMLVRAALVSDGGELLVDKKWEEIEEHFKYPSLVFYDNIKVSSWTALTGADALTSKFHSISTAGSDGWTPEASTRMASLSTVTDDEVKRKLSLTGGSFGYAGHPSAPVSSESVLSAIAVNVGDSEKVDSSSAFTGSDITITGTVSGDTDIATVTYNNNSMEFTVTGVAVGSTTVTVTVSNMAGSISRSYDVTVSSK